MNAISPWGTLIRSRGRRHACWLLLAAGLAQAGTGPVESSSSAPPAVSAAANGTQPLTAAGGDQEKLPGEPPATPRQPEAPAQPPGLHSAPADLGLPAIHFAAGSSSLTVDAQAILDVVAQIFLDAHKSGMVRIEGRSDGVESSPDGDTTGGRLSLSRARAEIVRDYLVSRGVPSARLIVVGRGDGAPVGELETEKDRERNRVVSFSAVSSGGSSMVREVPSGPGPNAASAGAANPSAANPSAANPNVANAGTANPSAANASASNANAPLGPSQPGGPAKGPASATTSGPEQGTAPPPPSSFPPGTRPATARDIEAVTVQAAPQIPSEVEDVRLGLKIVRRDGPGAATRTPWQSQEFLQQELAELERLYRSQLRMNRKLVGDTRIQIWLNAEGDVTAASVGLPSQDSAFELRLINFLKNWDPPPPPGKDEMRVEMVLTVAATFRPILTSPR